MAQGYDNEEVVGELVHRVQMHVMPRRVRAREFFNDFDPLRSGRCSEPNFARALAQMGCSLSGEETAILAEHFTEHGPKVVPPQVVNYKYFCDQVDQIFNSNEAQENMKSMMMTSSPSCTVMSTFVPNSVEDEERFMHVLHRVATLCKARGVAIKAIYVDLDRAPIPCPSMLNPRRGGKVTKEQFKRNWPFKKEMAPEDIELLCDRYATKEGDVHFMALHNEVSEVLSDPAQPFPTSPLHLRPDDTEWAHASVPVVDRITAKVVEKRARLKEHFQDFDPLRKGFCTPGQVKTTFTIMNLSKDIDRNDFEELLRRYLRDDGLFDYKTFCADVESAFTTPGLEKSPLAVLEMPDAGTTSPARRNPMRLSQTKLVKIGRIEDKIKTFVRKRRVLLKPMFQDFDRTNRGYITRNQFARIMSSMNFDLDEKAVGYLCASYCDFGNHNDFNWKRFLAAVDPPAEEVEVAMMQMTAPFVEWTPKPYFDKRGKVIVKSSSMPML